MSSSQGVSEFLEKTKTGDYKRSYISPILKYVKSLEKSGNNNLEEQLLLGPTRITKKWVDKDTNEKVTRTEFRGEDDIHSYYALEVRER